MSHTNLYKTKTKKRFVAFILKRKIKFFFIYAKQIELKGPL